MRVDIETGVALLSNSLGVSAIGGTFDSGDAASLD